MTAVSPGRKHNQFNLIAQAHRQAGSTFKTFVLAAAIEAGHGPGLDVLPLGAARTARPVRARSSRGTSRRTTTRTWAARRSRSATLSSDNTVYARLTLDVGAEKVASMARNARRAHAARRERRVRPVDRPRLDRRLAARHGVRVRDARRGRHLLEADGDHEGDPRARARCDKKAGWGEPERKRVLSHGVAYEVTKILEENVQSGTGVGAYFGRPAAGKTGTTDESRRRLVLRLHAAARRRPCGSATSAPRSRWTTCTASRSRAARSRRRSGTSSCSKALEYRHADRTSSVPYTATRRSPRLARRVAVHRRLVRPADERLLSSHDARRTTDRISAGRSALAAGAAVLAPHDGRRPARVAGRVAARAAERRPSGRRLVYAWVVPRAARRGVRRLRRRGRARARGARRASQPSRRSRARSSSCRSRAPLLLSTDAWTYWDYGRIAAVHDANPYEATPSDFPDDPAFPCVGTAWRDTTTVYGPAFTLASEPLALAAGHVGRRGGVDLQVARRASPCSARRRWPSRLSPRPALALAFVGWNPLLAVHFAGGGHNDAWVALLVLGALAAAAAGRRQLAGVVLGARRPRQVGSARAAAAARARGARDAAGRSATSASRVAAVVVAALARSRATAPAWLHAFGPLARNANHETQLGAAAPARAARRAARRSRSRSSALAFARRVRVARARGVARPRAPRPRDVRAAARGAVPRRLVRRVGRAARRRRGRRARGAALARALRVPAAPDDPALTSTAAGRAGRRARRRCSKTSRHAGCAAATTTCAAVGSGASRSA